MLSTARAVKPRSTEQNSIASTVARALTGTVMVSTRPMGSSDRTAPQAESKNRANNRPKRRRSR